MAATVRETVAQLLESTRDVIDQLLDALPELELAIPAEELVWRPGPFHRALAGLPVVFPSTAPLVVPGN